MITNGGNSEGLFRGAIMQSGGPIPVGDITHGQNYYDDIVMRTGCERSKDTLQCLREVPFTTLKGAIDQSPNFFAYQVRYSPRNECLVRIVCSNAMVGIGSGLASPCRRGILDGSAAAFGSSGQRCKCALHLRYAQAIQIRALSNTISTQATATTRVRCSPSPPSISP